MLLGSVRSLFQQPEFGLLWLRLSVGLLMINYGVPKLMGGTETLSAVGQNIAVLGIPAPEGSVNALIFGLMAALSQVLGGVAFIVGFIFRPAAFFLFATMSVATIMKIQTSGADISEYGHPLLMGLMIFGLFWTGPGRLSIQKD